jgi:Concanavalin A-like lectin/glucanases superfamily
MEHQINSLRSKNVNRIGYRYLQLLLFFVMITLGFTVEGRVEQSGDSFALSWHAVPASADNITQIYQLTGWDSYRAGLAATFFSNITAGRRAIMPREYIIDLFGDSSDLLSGYKSPWCDNRIVALENSCSDFFDWFKNDNSGSIDYLILDFEESLNMWSGVTTDAHADAIEADSRWTAGSSSVQQRYRTVNGIEQTGWILNDVTTASGRLTPQIYYWNALASTLIGEDLNEAVVDVVSGYFPSVQSSNYSHPGINESERETFFDLNGHPSHSEGGVFVGTHASTSMYGYIGNIADQKPAGISYVFGKKPFNGVLISLQKLRAMQRSHYSGTKDVPMMPWVPFKGWVYDKCAYGKTNYYDEMIYHTMLINGGDPLLFFNPDPSSPDNDEEYLNDLIDEVNLKMGGGNRTLKNYSAIPWDSKLLATSVLVGVNMHTRITTDMFVSNCTSSSVGSFDMRDRVGYWHRVYQSNGSVPTFTPVIDGLVAHWRMQESAWGAVGTYPVKDCSGNGYDGDINGNPYPTAQTAGAIGRAGHFDGIDDRLVFYNKALLDMSGNDKLTLAAWIKIDTNAANAEPVINNYNDGNGYLLEVKSDGNVRFMIDEDSTKEITTTGIDLKDAVWHHVAAVLDTVGTTSIMRIYVDGELSKSTTFSEFTIATSRDDIFIGRRGASHPTAEYFDGLIDEVSIWNRALTGAEMSKFYRNVKVSGYYGNESSYKLVKRIECESGTVGGGALKQNTGDATSNSESIKIDAAGESIEMTGIEGGAGGAVTLYIRYRSFDNNDSMKVYVNDTLVETIALAHSNMFANQVKLLVNLSSGSNNKIKLEWGSGTFWADYLLY